jgi:hypothetical protein
LKKYIKKNQIKFIVNKSIQQMESNLNYICSIVERKTLSEYVNNPKYPLIRFVLQRNLCNVLKKEILENQKSFK